MPPDTAAETRFLVCAPTGRDAALTCELLAGAGLQAVSCRDVAALCRLAADGAAGLILAQEALTRDALAALGALLAAQEPWSDLPVVLFTGRAAGLHVPAPSHMLLALLGNTTLLERPVQPVIMVSAARAALRARMRQYTARSSILEQQTAVRQRDEFLAMLGHELRNPLGAIRMAVELMKPDDQGARFAEVIRRQSDLLARLVDDLLEVSRVTSGKISLHRRPFDMRELVERCAQAARWPSESQGVRVGLALPDQPVLVYGDAARLEQVVTNLVNNAVKYTPSGGEIRIELDQRDEVVVLEVTDTGVGIAAEMLPRVFHLFAQAEAALDRAQGGLGIGLTLVRSLVELHGGTVEAASEGLGRGSRFTVRLPAPHIQAPGELAPSAAPQPRAARHHVLVVEDNPDSREVLVAMLERSGHRVSAVSDGPSGVSAALHLRPDVLVIDIGLPGLDGYGVARAVRRALGDVVYLVAVTGYGQPEDRRRAAEAGFDVHFTKPVDPAALRSLLERDHLARPGAARDRLSARISEGAGGARGHGR